MSARFSVARYEHHRGRWVLAGRGCRGEAGRHLYALRAHLSRLGWLAPEFDVPGYGVRERPPPPSSGRVVGTAAAAEYLGVRSNTIRRWADAGRLRHVRTPGGQRRFSTRDLDAFRP